jgi:hypothetical protein
VCVPAASGCSTCHAHHLNTRVLTRQVSHPPPQPHLLTRHVSRPPLQHVCSHDHHLNTCVSTRHVSRPPPQPPSALQVQHETDGFIFALNNEPYTPGTCNSLLKWKPPELNSFDFLARVFVASGGRYAPPALAYPHARMSTPPPLPHTHTHTLTCCHAQVHRNVDGDSK